MRFFSSHYNLFILFVSLFLSSVYLNPSKWFQLNAAPAISTRQRGQRYHLRSADPYRFNPVIYFGSYASISILVIADGSFKDTIQIVAFPVGKCSETLWDTLFISSSFKWYVSLLQLSGFPLTLKSNKRLKEIRQMPLIIVIWKQVGIYWVQFSLCKGYLNRERDKYGHRYLWLIQPSLLITALCITIGANTNSLR